METKYYTVSVDRKTWSVEPIAISEFTQRGFTFQPARRVGNIDIFMAGHKVAILFKSKADAVIFALEGV